MTGTGVGAVAGVGVAMLSGALAAHGVMTTTVATVHVSGDVNAMLNESPTATQTENTNPYHGPVDKPVTTVDSNGNAIRVETGQQITSSPNGEYQQVRDKNGKATGLRKDGPHGPNQKPHAHVPGTGDHLPIKTGE